MKILFLDKFFVALIYKSIRVIGSMMPPKEETLKQIPSKAINRKSSCK